MPIHWAYTNHNEYFGQRRFQIHLNFQAENIRYELQTIIIQPTEI